MTQLRKQKDAISNYFDRLIAGLGHRGSSFSDIDAITHDAASQRWLVQEFKQTGESLDKAQAWMLRDLSTLRQFTVWVVRREASGLVRWAEFRAGRLAPENITEDEYRQRFSAWWNNGRAQNCTPLETK